MVSDASKKKAAQKKAAAAAKRGGKVAASSKAAASQSQNVDKVADRVQELQISDRTCTGVLCSHPLSRDIRLAGLLKAVYVTAYTLTFPGPASGGIHTGLC